MKTSNYHNQLPKLTSPKEYRNSEYGRPDFPPDSTYFFAIKFHWLLPAYFFALKFHWLLL
ncbi:hypothetical protein T06_12485 [Trichinella sp. T6]|nr:hypothetical protein T06_12485 [Trichinella sp. T6]